MSKKKKIILIIVILLVMMTVIGVSYAYWFLTFSSHNPSKLVTSCLNLSLTNEKNDINLAKAYPISDAEGKKLTPYSFTITNTCDLFLSYTVNLEILNESTMPYKYIKAMVNNEAITKLKDLEDTQTTLENASSSKVLFKGTLGSGDSADYNIRLWMDEDVTVNDTDSMNTTFLSKVTIGAQRSTYIPSEQGYTTLANAILANEYQTTPEISKQKIAAKQTPDFSQTAPIILWQEKTADNLIELSLEEAAACTIANDYQFDSNKGLFSYVNPFKKKLLELTNEDLINNKYWMIDCYKSSKNDGTYEHHSSYAKIYQIVGVTQKDNKVILKLKPHVANELESDKSDKGLYQMADDDGTSYYYRGNVVNNYVKFDGYNWRIIRINGDGSVRLMYDKSNKNLNGLFSTLKDNSAYVGYMYGNTLNECYEKTIANENDSNVKTILDEWYKNNILGTSNESVVADAGFCNDRALLDGDGFSVGTRTKYAIYSRINLYLPTLKCQNSSNDLFTMSTNVKGNKALTYPIGLITADELMMSGVVYGYLNTLTYTFFNRIYWTMSPYTFNINNDNGSRNVVLNAYGNFGMTFTDANYGYYPVINIKGDAKISGGIGTSSSPYEIVTN